MAIKNKYLGALKLSGAYYNGSLVEAKPVIIVESTTNPEAGLDIHTNNVELLKDPIVMQEIIETVNNPISETGSTRRVNAPTVIRVNGMQVNINSRNSNEQLDEIASEPVVLTTGQLEEPSTAANINQI